MNLSLRQKDTIGDYGVIGIRLFNRTFQLGSENKGCIMNKKRGIHLWDTRRGEEKVIKLQFILIWCWGEEIFA